MLFGEYAHMKLLIGSGAGVSYDADAETLFAAMSTEPDATRKALISDTIIALKAAGIWDELDECWFLAAHAEQAGLLGWKRLRDCLAVNAPTFTQDRGFQGNGTTSYLNTQLVPSTDCVQYTLNDASFGAYLRTHSGTTSRYMMGNGSGGFSFITTSSYTSFRLNSGSATAADGIEVGLQSIRRTTSAVQEFFRNGIFNVSGSIASNGVITQPFYICVVNNGGSAFGFDNRQISFAFVGGGMTTQKQADLFTITENYLDVIGGGVV